MDVEDAGDGAHHLAPLNSSYDDGGDDRADGVGPPPHPPPPPQNESFYSEVCQTKSDDPAAQSAPVNVDAINYGKALRNSTIFETCAICDGEEGR